MSNITTQAENAKALSRTLAAHGVSADHVETYTGPTVTQFAFALEAGTPAKRVTTLAQDLGISIGQDTVRVLAPIPGTRYVGIEVPNEDRETVTYEDFADGDITDSESWAARSSITGLAIPVGVTVTSDTVWADLTKLPHLLIAGTTGSGKSVALTTIIAHLIATQSPDDLRLHLVDPKRVELQSFVDAPQVEQVATDPLDALDLLDSVVDIMDHRYSMFEKCGVRNITEFNSDHPDIAEPYHVVVVDELADLLMHKGIAKQAEDAIVRLAQLARAAGIHLILATQRPTRDVVTGLISANVTSRWCFRVGSHIDSNVALGSSGAEALYGAGDSLWSPAGSQKPVRVQAVYTSDRDIHDIVEQATINYGSSQAQTTSPDAADDGDEFDMHIEQEPINPPQFEAPSKGYPISDPVIEISVDTSHRDALAAPTHEDRYVPEEFVGLTVEQVRAVIEEALDQRENHRRAARSNPHAPLLNDVSPAKRWAWSIGIALVVVSVIAGSLGLIP